MKTRLLWSNVIYFQGWDSEIEPVERETIGNISSFIAVPVAESTSNLPLHQTSPIQQIERNESTDIDVDQSIEDLVSQSISSSTETQTNIFFLWKVTFDHPVSHCPSSARASTFPSKPFYYYLLSFEKGINRRYLPFRCEYQKYIHQMLWNISNFTSARHEWNYVLLEEIKLFMVFSLKVNFSFCVCSGNCEDYRVIPKRNKKNIYNNK